MSGFPYLFLPKLTLLFKPTSTLGLPSPSGQSTTPVGAPVLTSEDGRVRLTGAALETEIRMLVNASILNLRNVHPLVVKKVLKLVELLGYSGLYFAVFMGYRSFEVQDALYAQSRNSLSVVNDKRLKVGLPPITEDDNRRPVTKAAAGYSFHNFGLAADLVEDGDVSRVGIQWSWKNNANYLKLGDFAQKVGLDWGGFWKSFKDTPHVELPYAFDIRVARGIYLNTNSLQAVWDEYQRYIPQGEVWT